MKTKLIKIILLFITMLGFSLSLIGPSYAASSVKCSDLPTNSVAYEAAGCKKSADKLPKTIRKIINAVIAFSSTVAVVFVVVGGIQYMSSAGDTGKIEKGKKTVIYALIGLVICALAYAIVNWVIDIM